MDPIARRARQLIARYDENKDGVVQLNEATKLPTLLTVAFSEARGDIFERSIVAVATRAPEATAQLEARLAEIDVAAAQRARPFEEARRRVWIKGAALSGAAVLGTIVAALAAVPWLAMVLGAGALFGYLLTQAFADGRRAEATAARASLDPQRVEAWVRFVRSTPCPPYAISRGNTTTWYRGC